MTRTQWGGALSGIAFLIVFHSISPLEPITANGMTRIGLLLFAVMWWITRPVPLAVTSIGALAVGVLLGALTSAQAFASPTNWFLWFVIGAFGMSAALDLTGFNRRFALIFLELPFIRGRPQPFFFMFLFSAVLLSGMMANTVVTVVWLALANALYAALRLERGDAFAEMNTMGLGCAANIGGITTPVGTPTNAVAIGMIATATGHTISFLTWSLIGYFAALILVVTAFLVFRYILRPDISIISSPATQEFLTKERRKVGRMSRPEKYAVGWFIVAIILWLLPDLVRFVDADTGRLLSQRIGLVVPALLVPTAMCLTPVQNEGRRFLLTWSEWAKGVNWAMVIFVGGVLPLGAAVGADETGIPAYLSQRLEPLLDGLPEYAFVAVLVGGVMLLTAAVPNLVSVAVFLPLGLTLSMNLGLANPLALGIVLGMGPTLAYALPSGSPANAIVASSGWLRVSFMARWGVLLITVHAFVMAFLVYPFAKWLLEWPA